ncbi:MAG: hypothetical protein DMD72_14890, partial [Gemmatimonadetes bacterium]
MLAQGLPATHQFEISSASPRGAPTAAADWNGVQQRGQDWSEPEGVPWLRYLDVLKRNLLL